MRQMRQLYASFLRKIVLDRGTDVEEQLKCRLKHLICWSKSNLGFRNL